MYLLLYHVSNGDVNDQNKIIQSIINHTSHNNIKFVIKIKVIIATLTFRLSYLLMVKELPIIKV